MYFKLNTRQGAHETIEDETIIINFVSGKYYSLDKVGVAVWGFLEKGEPTEEIIKKLSVHYGSAEMEISKSINNFIAELQKEGLISPSTEEELKAAGDLKITTEIILPDLTNKFEAPVLHSYADMQELLLIDPIDDVDEIGWPVRKP
jgi:hypothetical protein